MNTVAFYDTKPDDRDYLERAPDAGRLHCQFHDFRLSSETAASVDNVFVFALLFSCFAVPVQYQHKVLFWVILGALIMRAIMIFAGAALINQFSWIIYIFGAFLILTGIKMVVKRDKQGRRRRARLRRLLARLRRSNYVYDSVRFQTTPRAWRGHSEPIGARRSARTV